MNNKKIEEIKLSLMKTDGEINLNNKTQYIQNASCAFKLAQNFYKDFKQKEQDSLTEELIDSMYNELIKLSKNKLYDSVGIWIKYDNKKFENSIKVSTLNVMKNLGTEDITPIYEFFKMTIIEN